MPEPRNETNALWRAVRTERRTVRGRNEALFTAKMERLIAAGTLGGRKLAEGHWRLWNPAQPSVTVDYWPRTGALVQHNVRLRAHGLDGALRTLAVDTPAAKLAQSAPTFTAAGTTVLDLRSIEHGSHTPEQWETIRAAMECGSVVLVAHSVAEYFRDVLPPRAIFAAGFAFAEGNDPTTLFLRVGTRGAPWLLQRGDRNRVLTFLRSLLEPVRDQLG